MADGAPTPALSVSVSFAAGLRPRILGEGACRRCARLRGVGTLPLVVESVVLRWLVRHRLALDFNNSTGIFPDGLRPAHSRALRHALYCPPRVPARILSLPRTETARSLFRWRLTGCSTDKTRSRQGDLRPARGCAGRDGPSGSVPNALRTHPRACCCYLPDTAGLAP